MDQHIENQRQESVSLRKMIITYLIHWKLVLLCFIISIILGIGYLIFYPKTYEFMSRIHIQDQTSSKSSGLPLGGELSGLAQSFGLGGMGSSIKIDDERKFFTTYELLKSVVEDVGIQVTYSKPFSLVKLYKQTPFFVSYATANGERPLLKGVKFTVKKNSAGEIFITKKVKHGKTEKFKVDNFPTSIKTNEGIFDFINNDEVKEKSYSYKATVSPSGWIAEDLMDEIIVDVAAKNSNIIELVITDHNVERGCNVLNSLMRNYNKRIQGFKTQEAMKQIEFYDRRIKETEKQLLEHEKSIEKFKEENQMTIPETDMKMMAEEIKRVNEKIIEVETERHIMSLLKSFVADPKNEFELIPALFSIKEGDKKSMISVYNELLLERNKLNSISRIKDNPKVKSYDKQLKELRENIVRMVNNADESFALTLKDLKNKDLLVAEKMRTIPSQEREFIKLKRNQEIVQALYLVLLQKKEGEQKILEEVNDQGRIIDPAYAKQKPIGPRKLYAAIGVLFFTLLFPAFILFIRKEGEAFVRDFKERF